MDAAWKKHKSSSKETTVRTGEAKGASAAASIMQVPDAYLVVPSTIKHLIDGGKFITRT